VSREVLGVSDSRASLALPQPSLDSLREKTDSLPPDFAAKVHVL